MQTLARETRKDCAAIEFEFVKNPENWFQIHFLEAKCTLNKQMVSKYLIKFMNKGSNQDLIFLSNETGASKEE